MSSEKPDTRTRILAAAATLLETDQVKAASMSAIAAEAGVSRQALYLHFGARADLLIATTRYIDDRNDIDARLAASRSASTGIDRLDAFIDAWGNYIPLVYPVVKALWAMMDLDEDAAAAIDDRDQAVRHGCQAAVQALKEDGVLSAAHSAKEATDILCVLLSVHSWEQYTRDCNWSQKRYVNTMKSLARKILVADETPR